jgi:hypothetical protein
MGTNLAWTGLTLLLVSPLLGLASYFALAGGIILIIGVVLMWLGK